MYILFLISCSAKRDIKPEINPSKRVKVSYNLKELDEIKKSLVYDVSTYIFEDKKFQNRYNEGFALNEKAIKSRAPNIETAQGFADAFSFINSQWQVDPIQFKYYLSINILEIFEMSDHLSDYLDESFLEKNIKAFLKMIFNPEPEGFIKELFEDEQEKYFTLLYSKSFWEKLANLYIKIFIKRKKIIHDFFYRSNDFLNEANKYGKIFLLFFIKRFIELGLDKEVEITPELKKVIDFAKDSLENIEQWKETIFNDS